MRTVGSSCLAAALLGAGPWGEPLAAQVPAEGLQVATAWPRFLAKDEGRESAGAPGWYDVSNAAVFRRRISLELTDVPRRRALEEIARQAGLHLTYSAAVVGLDAPVTLKASDLTVGAALGAVLYDAGVDVLLTSPGHAALIKRVALTQHQHGTIVGRVTDKKTSTQLAGATVVVEGTSRNATTGADGRYRITDVAVGNYTVRARYIGYAPSSATVTVKPDEETAADFGLERSATRLQDVVTVQKREERLINVPQSVTVLGADELTQAGTTQFPDFAAAVPGLSFSTAGAGFTQTSLRGVTVGFDVGPTTATYVDEVPYGSSTPFALSAQLTPDGTLAFVVNFNLYGDHVPSSVSVVFTPAMTEVARITTCTMPHGSRFNPTGTRHYSVCMMDDQLVEIDTRALRVSRRFALTAAHASSSTHDPAHCTPTWAQPSADGQDVFVACNASSEIIDVDVAGWSVKRRLPAGDGVYNLAVTHNRRYLLGTNKRGKSLSVVICLRERRPLGFQPGGVWCTASSYLRTIAMRS